MTVENQMRSGLLPFEADEDIRSAGSHILNDGLDPELPEIGGKIVPNRCFVSRRVLARDSDQVRGKVEQALAIDHWLRYGPHFPFQVVPQVLQQRRNW